MYNFLKHILVSQKPEIKDDVPGGLSQDDLNEALLAAAYTAKPECIAKLISLGADRESVDRAVEIVAAEGEASYRLRDEFCHKTGLGRNVLSMQKNRAQENGDYHACLEMLLESKLVNSEGLLSALKTASLKYRVESVRIILSHGIELEDQSLSGFFHFDSFEMAVQLPKKTQVLRLLLKAGIDVNHDKGKILATAILHGYDEFADLLLTSGTIMNTTFGQLALVYAAERGRVDLVSGILDRGAGIDDEDLLYAAACQGQDEVLRYLLEKGAASRHPEFLSLALEGAAEAGMLRTVKLLQLYENK